MACRIAYSCLVDNTPKLLWEGAVFVRSLTKIAGVSADDVVIHFTPAVPKRARTAIAGPCRVREVAPFDTRFGFANKVRQAMESWEGFDAVAFLDADMVVLAALPASDVSDSVSGVPVFGASPDEGSLRAIYRRFGPDRAGDWLRFTGLRGEIFATHCNNLNGGLYLVPIELVRAFGAAWAAEARRFLTVLGALEGAEPIYADQIAAGAALARLGLRAHHLKVTRNCPPPLARRLSSPLIVHDFGKFSVKDRCRAGHLRVSPALEASPQRRALAALIDEVNEFDVGRPFHAYRAFRYALYDEEFDRADRQIGAVEDGPFPFPETARDMRVHLGAYQRMVRRRSAASA